MVIKEQIKDSLTFPQYNSGKFTVTIEYMLIFGDIEYRATQ